MITDSHLHSSFSADSDSAMKNMIEAGIKKGLTSMCFTEHMDFDYKAEGLVFEVDMPLYHRTLTEYQKQYASQIELLFGIELGLEPHLCTRNAAFVKKWPFDFVIGSAHLANGRDPYYPAFFEGRTEKEAYCSYFESELSNLKAFSDFDSFGHLDYVVRYGPNRNRAYSLKSYIDVIEPVLRFLVEHGIALEVNTGGLKYGLGHPNPQEDILIRYRELGGELLTLGSDAHAPEHIAYDFKTARQILTDCGFHYYTIFKKRKAILLPIE